MYFEEEKEKKNIQVYLIERTLSFRISNRDKKDTQKIYVCGPTLHLVGSTMYPEETETETEKMRLAKNRIQSTLFWI